MISFSCSFADNMGYKCNQSSSTLKNEVTNTSVFSLIRNSSAYVLSRSQVHPRSLLHLFKWYFKSNALHGASDYEISAIGDGGSEQQHIVEGSNNAERKAATLAYRRHHENIRTTGAPCTRATTKTSTQTTAATTTSTSSSNLSHSHYVVRQSICLYAASSVILALCYLTTPTSASTDAASHSVWVSMCLERACRRKSLVSQNWIRFQFFRWKIR
jgi:Tfp pilus assembly major pilin PilA